MYAEPDPNTKSARLTFVSPSGIKLKSIKEVKGFLTDIANAPRIPVKGGLIEAEMEDPHEKRMEWVQGTITKILSKDSGFVVSFKVENAEEKGIWEETYKVGWPEVSLLRRFIFFQPKSQTILVCRLRCVSVMTFVGTNPELLQMSEEGTEWRWPQLSIDEFKQSAEQAVQACRKVSASSATSANT